MNNEAKKFQDKVREQGCIVCLLEYEVRTDGDIHHLLDGNRRMGDMFVICLCPTHHRSGKNTPQFVSRHPWRKEFEKRYGKEMDLYKATQRLVGDA
ncbi:Recombination enhancement, RecA-dependent nuclease [uncultured Caudovirales phage]|uniref:Recombination enhancement, RecA-dependent nuclease n=1 Tax=uncultured Caudovirales phage TaxID=2100421 RepID=A0A6J5MXW1_9CAUD|nr:Recombination enhancement, RecA-dependent nuclease [uncultured Caudovirales phage]